MKGVNPTNKDIETVMDTPLIFHDAMRASRQYLANKVRESTLGETDFFLYCMPHLFKKTDFQRDKSGLVVPNLYANRDITSLIVEGAQNDGHNFTYARIREDDFQAYFTEFENSVVVGVNLAHAEKNESNLAEFIQKIRRNTSTYNPQTYY